MNFISKLLGKRRSHTFSPLAGEKIDSCAWEGEHSGFADCVLTIGRSCSHNEGIIHTCQAHVAHLTETGGYSPIETPCGTCGELSKVRVMHIEDLDLPLKISYINA